MLIPALIPDRVAVPPNTTDEQDLNNDDDPFGLREQAETWLMAQLKATTEKSSSSNSYTPLDASTTGGEIPETHWDEAFNEFWRRFMDGTVTDSNCNADDGPSILLVATGVKEDWTPGEELRKAKFLFFPDLKCGDGTTTSALFITYMPGKQHGAADFCFATKDVGRWIGTNDLDDVLNGGLSSGDHNKPQPDCRFFPFDELRDGDQDNDPDNGDEAYSRLLWEVEYKNRNPIHMLRNGKRLMKSEYNRLYLAAKFYEPDSKDGKIEAAIVLWGRNNDDSIEVMEAVSFGTKDLSEKHKEQFAGEEEKDCLVGVREDEWRRPNVFPPNYPKPSDPFGSDAEREQFLLNIPVKEILYKIRVGETNGVVYFTDTPSIENVTELKIDLRRLLHSVVGLKKANPTAATAQSSSKRRGIHKSS